MSTFFQNQLASRAASAIATALVALASAGAHAQAADWQTNVSSCSAADAYTLNNAQINLAGGFVRAPAGPNPPVNYVCN